MIGEAIHICLQVVFAYIEHSQNRSFWIERFSATDLVENCSCIHQDLPDVVVIPSRSRQYQVKYLHYIIYTVI